MSIPLRVLILGREYPLRVQEEDEATMREVAVTVDERMQAFRQSHPGEPELTAAVFAALSLAAELFAAKDHESRAEDHLAGELAALADQLAAALSVPGEPAAGAGLPLVPDAEASET